MANDERKLRITTPTDREIVVTRSFDAPRQMLFDVWTRPEHLPRWMTGPEGWTMPVCEIDPRVGGAWHFVYRNDSGNEMEMRGSYTELSPPDRIVSTETWGPEWPETVNTVEFTEKDGRTTVTQTSLYPTKDARDAALKSGMDQGMSASFDRLDAYMSRTLGATGVPSITRQS